MSVTQAGTTRTTRHRLPTRRDNRPLIKPGIIALRPLNLSDIFNGAFGYIRANPKTTLGVATIVVVIAQLLALLLQFGPLATSGILEPRHLTGPTPTSRSWSGPSSALWPVVWPPGFR